VEFLRQIQSHDDARTEALRALGGLLFGTGVLVLLLRKTSFVDPWGEGVLLVTWLISALILYGGGILAARAAEPRAWHSVWVVFGILFVYGTLMEFLSVIDANPDAPLNTVWTLCVVAAVAAGAAVFARVRFGWLLAGLALVGAWLSLWDEILESGVADDIGTFRGLCMIAAIGLVAGAWMIERRGRERAEAAELVTAAGLIFLLGAGLVSLAGAAGSLFSPFAAAPSGIAEPSLFWDLVLLVGSIALVAVGSFARLRGTVYVGAAGILTFVFLVGFDLDDDSPAGKVVGWPLILLVLALLAIAGSVAQARKASG